MKNITVRYGVDSLTKQVEEDFTFGDLQHSDTFKAALGFTACLEHGVQPDELLAELATAETAA